MVIIVLVGLVLLLGNIAGAFNVSAGIAFLILLGFVAVVAAGVYATVKISEKYPKAVEFLTKTGKILAIVAIVVGVLLFIISFTIHGGTELRTYENIYGGTTAYLAEKVSVLNPIGLVLIAAGAILYVASRIIDG